MKIEDKHLVRRRGLSLMRRRKENHFKRQRGLPFDEKERIII
jgi:hypothetical protein